MLSPTLDTVRLFVHVLAASVWVGGQIALGGIVPISASFDTVGPLCRTVADAAVLFRALTDHPVAQAAGFRGASDCILRLSAKAPTPRAR